MFCSSESCDSAICLLKPRSGPVDIEALYSLYSPFPLFTQVRGIEILRTSPFGDSRKLNFRSTGF